MSLKDIITCSLSISASIFIVPLSGVNLIAFVIRLSNNSFICILSAFMIIFLSTLFMIFISNALMNMFGLMMELHNVYTRKLNEKVRWTAYYLGVVAGAVPWIVITAFFINTGVEGGLGDVPLFVYWIYGIEIFFFNTFAINMILQYKGVGKWKDYFYGER